MAAAAGVVQQAQVMMPPQANGGLMSWTAMRMHLGSMPLSVVALGVTVTAAVVAVVVVLTRVMRSLDQGRAGAVGAVGVVARGAATAATAAL